MDVTQSFCAVKSKKTEQQELTELDRLIDEAFDQGDLDELSRLVALRPKRNRPADPIDQEIDRAFEAGDLATAEKLLDRKAGSRVHTVVSTVKMMAADFEAGRAEVDAWDALPFEARFPNRIEEISHESPEFRQAYKAARIRAAQAVEDEDLPIAEDALDEARDELYGAFEVIRSELLASGRSETELRLQGRITGLEDWLAEERAEFLAAIRDAAETARPTGGMAVLPVDQVAAVAAPPTRKAGYDQIPAELLRPGGFLGRLMREILDQSRKPQPEFALAASLAILSLLTGRKIKSREGLRTNLYAVAIARSGEGKEAPRAFAKKLLAAVGQSNLASEGAVSGAGVLAALRENPCHLALWDEIGLTLEAIGDKNAGPHLKSIISILLRLFTSAGSEFSGEIRADMRSSAASPIIQPHAVVYGTTTPDSFFRALDEAAVNDGLLGRMLIFLGLGEYIQPNLELQDELISPEILTEARWWVDHASGGSGNLLSLAPRPRTVDLTSESAGLYGAWLRRRDRDAYDAGGWRGTILVRAGEHAMKLAMLHAVSLDCTARSAGIESVVWATQLTDFLLGRLADLAAAKVSSNPYEKTQNELVEYIASRGASGATLNDLAQRFRKIRAKDRNEALLHAQEAGRLVATVRPAKAGRPAVVYVAAID